MIEAPHYTPAGVKKPSGFTLPEAYFDGTVNDSAMHQAVKVYLNNQRQGTHATKTRSFVSGGNQKPWKQKGTGRARQGSTRAPHWRGGGIVFGPSPRDYHTEIPRKVKQLARKSALNARAADGSLFVIEPLDFPAPRTSQLVDLLGKLGVAGRKALLLTHGSNPAVYLSGRNIPQVQVMHYTDASAYDILWADAVVIEEGAFSGAPPAPPKPFVKSEKPARAEAPAEKPKRAARPKAEAPKAEAKAEKPKKSSAKPKAEAKSSKSTAKKSAKSTKSARKSAPKKKGGK